MKKFKFLFLLIMSISFLASAQQIEVEGAIQSDSLVGTNNRLVQSNASGEISDVPEGNVGDLLSQGTQGVQWSSAPSGTNTFACDTTTCPTIFSATSANTLRYGPCLRHCYTLTEGGHEDWRIPTMEEVFYLYGATTSEDERIWTTNLTQYDPTHLFTGTYVYPERIVIDMATGQIEDWIPDDGNTIKCKCVR